MREREGTMRGRLEVKTDNGVTTEGTQNCGQETGSGRRIQRTNRRKRGYFRGEKECFWIRLLDRTAGR